MHGRTRTRIMAAAALATISGSALAVSDPVGATPTAAAPGVAASLAFTHSRHDIILIAAGLILLLVVVLFLRVTRRRRDMAAGSAAEPQRTFPPSADTWHSADLVRESNAPLPSFHQSEVVLPTDAPGWHPVVGDQTKLAYWDGTQWAAYRQWDGQTWVDASAVGQ
jgi:hypothetical protein